MKRTILALGSALVMIAFSVTLGGAAWSATGRSTPAVHHPVPVTTHGSCSCSTTTTTTVPPTTTTTTTSPPATTTTTTTAPPPTTTLPVPPPVSGPQPPAPAVPVISTPTPVPAPLTQLPFTGRNLKPLLVAGVLLVALGLALLAPSEYWRRASRRLSDLFSKDARGPSAAWMAHALLALRSRGAPSLVGWSFFGL